MNIYKISFVKNKIVSITEAEPGTYFDGKMFCEQMKGQLIFAIVKAESREAAELTANEIVDRVTRSLKNPI